jgi:hypothetical protein
MLASLRSACERGAPSGPELDARPNAFAEAVVTRAMELLAAIDHVARQASRRQRRNIAPLRAAIRRAQKVARGFLHPIGPAGEPTQTRQATLAASAAAHRLDAPTCTMIDGSP